MNINSNYERICSLVAEDKLEMIRVIGLPRSNGTALHIALTQAKEVDGQLNEPLEYPDLKGRKWDYRPGEKAVRTFEDGCAFILQRYEVEAAKKEGKVTLVIHDLSQDISDAEFLKLKKVDKHTVFMVRDPIANALSMLTRYVNDKLCEPGGNVIKANEVLALMKDDASFFKGCAENDKISRALVSGLLDKKDLTFTTEECKAVRKKVLDTLVKEYSLAWQNIHHFHVTMQEGPTSQTSVFDGSWLFNNVEEHLQSLVQKIGGLTYTPKMINGWEKGVRDTFYCVITRNWGPFAQTNAWNGPVRNSTGIVKQKDSMGSNTQLEQFPEEVWATIRDSQRMYAEIMRQAS